jgi:putative membrane protein
MERMEQLRKESKLLPEHLLFLQAELNNFTDAVGACERIRKTPIPFSYSVFLKKFIFLYVMTLPFGFVFSLGYWVIPVVSIIFYVLASLELIAEEIEDPFGSDANDLPTEEIALGIRVSIRQLLD